MSASALDDAAHRKLAASLFNFTWTSIEKADRTSAEEVTMIHAAHTSRYHWGIVGTPTNQARGEWQISRVYSVCGRAEPALYHARECLRVSEEHGLGAFDSAFAHEALARGHAVAGEAAEARRHVELARQLAGGIRDADDRALLLGDLATIRIPE